LNGEILIQDSEDKTVSKLTVVTTVSLSITVPQVDTKPISETNNNKETFEEGKESDVVDDPVDASHLHPKNKTLDQLPDESHWHSEKSRLEFEKKEGKKEESVKVRSSLVNKKHPKLINN